MNSIGWLEGAPNKSAQDSRVTLKDQAKAFTAPFPVCDGVRAGRRRKRRETEVNREDQAFCAERKRSASIAAMQPDPAAVIAWR